MDRIISDRILLSEESVNCARNFFSKFSKKYDVIVLNSEREDSSKPCVIFVSSSMRSLINFIEKFKKKKIGGYDKSSFIGMRVERFCNIEGEPF